MSDKTSEKKTSTPKSSEKVPSKRPPKTSKYKGVTYRKDKKKKYQARLYKEKKGYNIGIFDVSADAALAYDVGQRLMEHILLKPRTKLKALGVWEENADVLVWAYLPFHDKDEKKVKRKTKLNFSSVFEYNEARQTEIIQRKMTAEPLFNDRQLLLTVKSAYASLENVAVVIKRELPRAIKKIIEDCASTRKEKLKKSKMVVKGTGGKEEHHGGSKNGVAAMVSNSNASKNDQKKAGSKETICADTDFVDICDSRSNDASSNGISVPTLPPLTEPINGDWQPATMCLPLFTSSLSKESKVFDLIEWTKSKRSSCREAIRLWFPKSVDSPDKVQKYVNGHACLNNGYLIERNEFSTGYVRFGCYWNALFCRGKGYQKASACPFSLEVRYGGRTKRFYVIRSSPQVFVHGGHTCSCKKSTDAAMSESGGADTGETDQSAKINRKRKCTESLGEGGCTMRKDHYTYEYEQSSQEVKDLIETITVEYQSRFESFEQSNEGSTDDCDIGNLFVDKLRFLIEAMKIDRGLKNANITEAMIWARFCSRMDPGDTRRKRMEQGLGVLRVFEAHEIKGLNELKREVMLHLWDFWSNDSRDVSVFGE